MNRPINHNDSPSPFHKGEQAIQARLGVRDKMEQFGRQVIRDYMPDQHREFYKQLPFILVGHADDQGWPWASMLFGPEGFITSDDERSLRINANPVLGDPLADALQPGNRLGLLGIDLESRRRNRLSGHISSVTNKGIELTVDQAFGNCPQYIQQRALTRIDSSSMQPASVTAIERFDAAAVDLILNSDTFFVASHYAQQGNRSNEGADVSHRGGKPGFIRVDDDRTLTIPDYAGNFHFNTLGNFLENPEAGLLFIDFAHAHLLTLTGTVEIVWDSPDRAFFQGAERLWTFCLEHGRWLKNVLPFRWNLQSYSPNTQLTGRWPQASAAKKAHELKNTWQPYKIVRIVAETPLIKSFYLQAPDNQQPKFTAGQFLTVKALIDDKEQIRTYTVSSAPGDELFRISIKQEGGDHDKPAGIFSSFMHQQISEGDTLYAKAPTGSFTFTTPPEHPAVLISAGIGITPMLSIAKHVVQQAIRTRQLQALTLICTARNDAQRAFYQELDDIARYSGGKIQIFWALTQPEANLTLGVDYHFKGRPDKDWLESRLPQEDFDAYLCGPAGFMQSQYEILRKAGQPDQRIFAEAFGPSTLIRDKQSVTNNPAAEQAVVSFSRSRLELSWSKEDGNLLAFAESHGLTPDYGCRSGQCGACKVKLLKGQVAYLSEIEMPLKKDEVLLCCAVPAVDKDEEAAKLWIDS